MNLLVGILLLITFLSVYLIAICHSVDFLCKNKKDDDDD